MKKKRRPTGKSWELLKILLGGEFPSTMELVERCNMTRPGSVIHYLKKKFKVPIETEIIKQKNGEGEMTRFARYRISFPQLHQQRERFGF